MVGVSPVAGRRGGSHQVAAGRSAVGVVHPVDLLDDLGEDPLGHLGTRGRRRGHGGDPAACPPGGAAPSPHPPRTWLSLADDSRKMAPHDAASFFPSSVFTSRLGTKRRTGRTGHWVLGGGGGGKCEEGDTGDSRRGRNPQSPPHLCRDRSALFPTSTTGMLWAQGGGGEGPAPTPGTPPLRGIPSPGGTQHLPRPPPALVQLVAEGLHHLEAGGEGESRAVPPPPRSRGPIPKLGAGGGAPGEVPHLRRDVTEYTRT